VDFVYGMIQGGVRVEVEYFGRASHQAASPEKGLNALDAMVTAYNAVAQLRQHIRRDARLACIITHGGDAVNVVPEHAAGVFSARAGTIGYLNQLKSRLKDCIEAGAMATGCRVEMKWAEFEYAPFRHNHALADAYITNGRALGKEFLDLSNIPVGGTDMANVSQVVPAIHPEFAIGGAARPQNHTREFTDAAITEHAHEAMLDAARLLAMTAVEVALDQNLLARAKAEFADGVSTKAAR
jgi:metal-dependent amidase/aminoacylase/carboxypeptidase family protein